MPGPLKDGYQTLITFDLDPNVSLWEKMITPPGLDGRGPINQTTMRNEDYDTDAPKSLVRVTEMTFTAAYLPAAYPEILAMMQLNQQITVTFSNGDTMTFWGFIDKFIPDQLKEGEQPTATVTVCSTNMDNNDVEASPTFNLA